MHYVYLLRKCITHDIYVGATNDLRRRFKEHNSHGVQWELIYYEAYKSKTDAILREKGLTYYGRALGQLKRRIKLSLYKLIGAGRKVRASQGRMLPNWKARFA